MCRIERKTKGAIKLFRTWIRVLKKIDTSCILMRLNDAIKNFTVDSLANNTIRCTLETYSYVLRQQ